MKYTEPIEYVCYDCEYVVITSEDPEGIPCPRCGGKRWIEGDQIGLFDYGLDVVE